MYVVYHYSRAKIPYRRACLAECAREQRYLAYNSIARQYPDGRLEWEVDFPRTEESFDPFLSTQIRVDEDGIIHSNFVRKKQKKDITLHYLSHHSFKTKVQTIKEFYRTAEASSSSPEYTEGPKVVIDRLLRCNGYDNPRQYIDYRYKGRGVNKV